MFKTSEQPQIFGGAELKGAHKKLGFQVGVGGADNQFFTLLVQLG